jgi:LDH2 family malate/lactate/ureidoglycolate dehydrogenase
VEFYQVNTKVFIKYIDIVCIGSHFGPWVRSWKSSNTEANLGQCFIAIDPNAFEDDFEERLQKLINYCRNLQPSG